MALLPNSGVSNPEVVLGLGSNIGDRLSYLSYALSQLRNEAGEITSLSSVWETEPWGFEAEELFLNMVAVLITPLDPQSLLASISSIETRLGRQRRKSLEYQSRVIDIDILLWGERIITMPGLQVPHPRISQRRFVLEPLCEVVPDAIHPVSRMTMKDLLILCKDPSEVKLYKKQL